MLRQRDQRLPLRRVRSIVDHQHSLRRIWFAIRIAQRRSCAYGCRHRQPVELHAIPRAFCNMPRQQCLVAGQPSFAVGKALRNVNVGGTRLDIVATNLLRRQRNRESKNSVTSADFRMAVGLLDPKCPNIR